MRHKIGMGLIEHSDYIFPLGLVVVLGMMIVPIPTAMMDVMLALNISMSFLVLLLASYIKKQLEFSIFPALLLVLTLFRLSLNVASTRLILGQAYAGKVIKTFGNFVVTGNYVVGLVIFLIIVIIQFIVITKGAGRIAEVAARFILDALPGKQMSIDADLSAGVIDEDEARQMRKDIAKEADFYGAMDGASKFVRGDAIAGLIITLINIVGGLVIGVAQMKMTFGEAVSTYTLLTVGDGLVSQIPALLVSTAAGLMVTRSASKKSLGREIAGQFFSNPRPVFITAGIILIVMLLPGMPKVPFMMIAGSLGVLGYAVKKAGDSAPEEEELPDEDEGDDDIPLWAPVEPLEIELGFDLLELVDEERPGNLLERIPDLRRKHLLETGFRIPAIRIRDNLGLPSSNYRISFYGNTAGEGTILMNKYLALPPEGMQETMLEGEKTVDPAFGVPAVWVPPEMQIEAEDTGHTVIEPEAVLITHLGELVNRMGYKLLDRQSVQDLVDQVQTEFPAIVEDVIPEQLPLGVLQRVLQGLLKEGVPISNITVILETLADVSQQTKDPKILVEMTRHALSEEIYQMFVEPDGKLYAVSFDPNLEAYLQKSTQNSKDGSFNIAPQTLSTIFRTLRSNLDRMKREGHPELLIVSPSLRGKLHDILEPLFPELDIISYAEMPLRAQLQSKWIVSLNQK